MFCSDLRTVITYLFDIKFLDCINNTKSFHFAVRAVFVYKVILLFKT